MYQIVSFVSNFGESSFRKVDLVPTFEIRHDYDLNTLEILSRLKFCFYANEKYFFDIFLV